MADDLDRYINERKKRDPEFAHEFELGYANFKLGILLRQAREASGLTQAEIAKRLRTRANAISKIENNADEARLSLLQRYAKALGKSVYVRIA